MRGQMTTITVTRPPRIGGAAWPAQPRIAASAVKHPSRPKLVNQNNDQIRFFSMAHYELM